MTTSVYRSLFLMLEAKRFDYFPRSVIEVEQELLAFQGLAIGMSQHWLLYYQAPLYFFLPPNEVELAKELHEGLMNLHKKNQFLPIFLRFYGERIERLRLSERRVLRSHNPLLPASAPLNQPELWWSFPNAD